MRTCRHCQRTLPDDQFVYATGTVCRNCDKAQKRGIDRHRRARAAAQRPPAPPLIVDLVRQALAEHGALTAREISGIIGVTPAQAASSINRLWSYGKVACVGRIARDDGAGRAPLKRWQLCDTPASSTGGTFRDPEHEQWLATVRAMQRRKQQRMEWRV